jgi:hypothetical protein
LNIKVLLGESFCLAHSVLENKEYKIEYVSARDLLTSQRIDLIAKYKYVEFYEKGYDLAFIKSVYVSHISAFSFGTYTEFGEEDRKDSIEKFLSIFHDLIASVKEKGVQESISAIPVGKDNVILDGAHRTAIAAYFNQTVPVVRFENMQVNFGPAFFKEHFLDDEIIDYLVSEYCKLKKNIYAAIIWPMAQNDNLIKEITKMLDSFGGMIYKKKVVLTYNGMRNLLIQAYEQHQWVGTPENNFSGVFSQVDGCWHKNGTLTFILFENCTLEELVGLKTKIRDFANLGNYAMHSTDNKNETLLLVNLLINKNSVHLLNYGYPDKFLPFYKRILIFRACVERSGADLEEFIVDSSSILALYGLRNSGDLDYLTSSNGFAIITDNDFENHVGYIDLYGCTIDRLLFDPTKHLYFLNIKFVTLETLLVFKCNRHQKKDVQDTRLILSFLVNKNSVTHVLYKRYVAILRFCHNKKYVIKRKIAYSNIWKKYFRPIYKFLFRKNEKTQKFNIN